MDQASLLSSTIIYEEAECLKILIEAGAEVNQKSVLSLKNICRKVIRKTLIEMNPRQNLFQTVPKLGLPSSLNDYLLYCILQKY